MLMGGSMFAAMMVVAPSLADAQQTAANVEQVTVTGYAASLEKATDAKRNCHQLHRHGLRRGYRQIP